MKRSRSGSASSATSSSSSSASTSGPSSSAASKPTDAAPRSPSPSPSDDEQFEPASPEVVAAYEQLMTSLLPDIDMAPAAETSASAPASAPAPAATVPVAATTTAGEDEDAAAANAAIEAALGRPMTKAEKLNAKKKRKKERERALRAEFEAVRAAAEPVKVVVDEAPVSFPLFSTGVQPVSLSTVESYAVPSNPRLAPLPVAVRERIARMAVEAAVSLPDIQNAPRSEFPEKPVDTLSVLPGQDARAKHERGKGTSKNMSAMPVMFAAIAPAGTAGKCVTVPYLKCRGTIQEQVEKEEEEAHAGRRKRSRSSRRAYRQFPPPQKWQPAEGEEAASEGYFYGWSV